MALLKIYCNDELKSKFALRKPVTHLGRAADNDVVIDNAGVSLHHARIVQHGETFFIEDDDSTNGVFVNGERVTRKQLQYGDEIVIHKHSLKFSAVDLSPSHAAISAAPISQPIVQNPTVEIDSEQLQGVLKERQADPPYLLQIGGQPGRKFVLSKPRCNIGKDSNCDIVIGGWFAPKLAAKIAKQSGGYFIFPEKGGRVRLNGVTISEPVRLQPRDNLEIRGTTLTYYEAAADYQSSA